ncbi:MAG: glutamate racemase [Massiliimalia sp.]|jgi:glutamate racemase
MDKRPIGVFDSGLGGITAVHQLKKLMPHEDIVYFGDTSRVPYGTRSRETIQKYTAQDIRFLLSKDVKMVLAACGTVSTNLSQPLIDSLHVPFTGVLLPAAQAACAATSTGRIGVLATSASIKSGAYGKAIRNIIHNPKIIGKACPLFVPLIENGYVDRENPITTAIAREYLEPVMAEKVDTLILGCTHYPIIKALIGDLVGPDIRLIDPGKEAARSVQAFLTQSRMLNDQEGPGQCHYYVSDDVESFAQNAGVFLEESILGDVEKIDIDQY